MDHKTSRGAGNASPDPAQTIHNESEPLPQQPRASIAYIHHRGTNYTALSYTEQIMALPKLQGLCHTKQRLSKERYPVLAKVHSLTPPPTTASVSVQETSPTPKSAAIVLDCEMAGTTIVGDSELVHVTAIDFLSGRVLLDRLVQPDLNRIIVEWRTEITGITAASMRAATARGETLKGWKAARDELRRFVDAETILIGQSLHHDLKSLHTSHDRVVDTAVLAFDAVLGEGLSHVRKRWGLKELCRELLGVDIRQPSRPGQKAVHDALEDALATRELVLCFLNNPAKVDAWVTEARIAYQKDQARRELEEKARMASLAYLEDLEWGEF